MLFDCASCGFQGHCFLNCEEVRPREESAATKAGLILIVSIGKTTVVAVDVGTFGFTEGIRWAMLRESQTKSLSPSPAAAAAAVAAALEAGGTNSARLERYCVLTERCLTQDL
jgi:hypothetical protein